MVTAVLRRGACVVASTCLTSCTFVAGLGPPLPTDSPDTSRPVEGDAVENAMDARADLDEVTSGDVQRGESSFDDVQSDESSLDDVSLATGTVQAVTIAVGGAHACAVVQDPNLGPDQDTVRCWGANTSGDLGNPGAASSSSVPLAVVEAPGSALTGVKQGQGALALSTGYTCAVTLANVVKCWGAIPVGVMRQTAMPFDQPSPLSLSGSTSAIAGVSTIAADATGGCVLQPQLLCWGQLTPQSGVVLDGAVLTPQSYQQVVAGRAHACAIDSAARVVCWGANDRGQAGQSPSSTVSLPATVPVPESPVSWIAAGGDTSCAVAGAHVYCWGANDSNQLGVAGADSAYPYEIAGLPAASAATEVAVGDAHVCAIVDDAVWCWGDNSASQIGIGRVSGPVAFPLPVDASGDAGPAPLGKAVHIAAGGNTTCAIRFFDDRPWCWGANDAAQAGQPDTTAPVGYAAPVSW
jgi:hypothetical protein